jgi:hypothetical protein
VPLPLRLLRPLEAERSEADPPPLNVLLLRLRLLLLPPVKVDEPL